MAQQDPDYRNPVMSLSGCIHVSAATAKLGLLLRYIVGMWVPAVLRSSLTNIACMLTVEHWRAE
jgi:hypothetical protein